MIKIRAYADSDYEDVKLNLEEGHLFHPEDSSSNFRAKIERNHGSIIVAETEGHAVGNIFIYRHPENIPTASLWSLAVRRACRKQGIGSLLLSDSESRLRKEGIKEAVIMPEREDLREYYIKRGYVPSGHPQFMYKIL
ncbi:MAG: GNAT family N-acetyltransferase [Candidatus Aenigmarchaeota archaeon]|nr:GNAT family N-acetyltransferase [Candidatus Aenigmarchaeota archaeon]